MATGLISGIERPRCRIILVRPGHQSDILKGYTRTLDTSITRRKPFVNNFRSSANWSTFSSIRGATANQSQVLAQLERFSCGKLFMRVIVRTIGPAPHKLQSLARYIKFVRYGLSLIRSYSSSPVVVCYHRYVAP